MTLIVTFKSPGILQAKPLSFALVLTFLSSMFPQNSLQSSQLNGFSIPELSSLPTILSETHAYVCHGNNLQLATISVPVMVTIALLKYGEQKQVWVKRVHLAYISI
jgi:hypothetical protein